MKWLGLLLAVCAGLLCASPAQAIVPPTDCGTFKVGARKYQIKADQLTCRTAVRHSRRYLRSHKRPKGYTCRTYGAETKLKFRCERGIKVFFAIRR